MKFIKEALCIWLLLNCLFSIFAKRRSRFENLKLKARYLSGKSRVLKSYMRHKDDDVVPVELKTKVLVNTQTIILNKQLSSEQLEKNQGCPDGYVFIQDKDLNNPTHLNKGAIGDFVYICAQYKSYLEIVKGEVIVNKLHLQIDSTKCSNGMSSDGLDLNSGSITGKRIYLCRGHYQYSKGFDSYPITSLMTRTFSSNPGDTSINFIWQDNKFYQCLNQDLNQNAGGSYQYLCFYRDANAPKKVEYHNLVINLKGKKQNIAAKNKVTLDEYSIQNGDGSKELTIVGERSLVGSASKSTSGSAGSSYGLGKEFGDSDNDPLALSLEVTSKLTSSVQVTKSTESTSTSAFECTAPAGRYVRCQLFTNISSYDIPYTYTKTFTLFNGNKHGYTGSGIMSQLSATDIEVSSCCYNMCKAGDLICPEKNDRLGKVSIAKVDSSQDICNIEMPEKLEGDITPTKITLKEVGLVDAEVLVDLKMVRGKSDVECANKAYTKIPLDLMQGNGGNYVYICAKYLKVSEIQNGMNTINQIVVQYGTNKCGNLKNVTTFTNSEDSDADGSNVFICFGRNEHSKKKTISKIDITLSNTPATTVISSDEEQDEPLPIQQVGSLKYIHITRHNKVPKKVIIKNYVLTGSQSKSQTRLPHKVDSIVVYGSSVTRKIETSKKIETTTGFDLEMGISVTKDYGIDITTGGEFSIGTENVKSTTNTETQEITCEADPNKVMKCSIYKSTKRMVSSYTVEQEYIGYDDKPLGTFLITGELESNESGSVSVKTCCVDGCCTGDENDKERDQCWDSESNESKGKDIKCSELEQCLSKQAEDYDKLKATTRKLKTVTIEKKTSK